MEPALIWCSTTDVTAIQGSQAGTAPVSSKLLHLWVLKMKNQSVSVFLSLTLCTDWLSWVTLITQEVREWLVGIKNTGQVAELQGMQFGLHIEDCVSIIINNI